MYLNLMSLVSSAGRKPHIPLSPTLNGISFFSVILPVAWYANLPVQTKGNVVGLRSEQ